MCNVTKALPNRNALVPQALSVTEPTAQALRDVEMPYRGEVIELLHSLWSPKRIHRYLTFRYGPEQLPSVQAIEELRLVLPSRRVNDQPLEPTALMKRTGGVEGVRYDVEAALHRVLRLQEVRVSNALLMEECKEVPLSLTSDMLDMYWKMLKDAGTFLQSTGEVPKLAAAKPDLDEAGAQRQPIVQQTVILLKDLLPDTHAPVAQAAGDQKAIAKELGLLPEEPEVIEAQYSVIEEASQP